MRLVFGIVLLIIGVWFLTVTIRALSLGIGTYRPGYLHPTTRRDILRGFLVSAIAGGVGIFLIWG